jgi:hypothetical protein
LLRRQRICDVRSRPRRESDHEQTSLPRHFGSAVGPGTRRTRKGRIAVDAKSAPLLLQRSAEACTTPPPTSQARAPRLPGRAKARWGESARTRSSCRGFRTTDTTDGGVEFPACRRRDVRRPHGRHNEHPRMAAQLKHSRTQRGAVLVGVYRPRSARSRSRPLGDTAARSSKPSPGERCHQHGVPA